MKTVLAAALILATLSASAASARPFHHRVQVCSMRHHHRVCTWR